MDPRRKKIYYILIAGSLTLSAGILGWSYLSTPSTVPNHTLAPNPNPTQTATSRGAAGSVLEGFTAPPVFPANDKFSTEVLESESFRKLNRYSPVDVTGQLGREDPFRSY